MKFIEEDYEIYPKKLAEIAAHFGFDGYLMNFEAKLPSVAYLDKLYVFLAMLRTELKTQVGLHAEVIWYDSVNPVNGLIQWKSCLYEEN
jgi:mannosyl-glycoprotein endo-beta-N-acetylglucosaminidase